MLLAARWNCRTQKNRHFGTIAHLCRAISSQRRHISTIGKNLLSNNKFSTCAHNMVNFGLLTAKICWRVWGTPANFNGFRVLAALLHASVRHSSSGRQPKFAALNRWRHLYSTGWLSRWALAHILVTAALPSRCGHYIFALWFLLLLLLSSFFFFFLA